MLVFLRKLRTWERESEGTEREEIMEKRDFLKLKRNLPFSKPYRTQWSGVRVPIVLSWTLGIHGLWSSSHGSNLPSPWLNSGRLISIRQLWSIPVLAWQCFWGKSALAVIEFWPSDIHQAAVINSSFCLAMLLGPQFGPDCLFYCLYPSVLIHTTSVFILFYSIYFT
jgi:hypothetical protein